MRHRDLSAPSEWLPSPGGGKTNLGEKRAPGKAEPVNAVVCGTTSKHASLSEEDASNTVSSLPFPPSLTFFILSFFDVTWRLSGH